MHKEVEHRPDVHQCCPLVFIATLNLQGKARRGQIRQGQDISFQQISYHIMLRFGNFIYVFQNYFCLYTIEMLGGLSQPNTQKEDSAKKIDIIFKKYHIQLSISSNFYIRSCFFAQFYSRREISDKNCIQMFSDQLHTSCLTSRSCLSRTKKRFFTIKNHSIQNRYQKNGLATYATGTQNTISLQSSCILTRAAPLPQFQQMWVYSFHPKNVPTRKKPH